MWTPPPGVSTAVFGDSLQDFTQKSEKVDMWTSVCLIILKATTVHQHPGGAQSQKQNQVSQPDPASAAGTLWGALSLSTARCAIYNLGVWPSPEKKDEGGRGARVAGGQKEKRRSSKWEGDGGGILEEAFPARWNLWTATL